MMKYPKPFRQRCLIRAVVGLIRKIAEVALLKLVISLALLICCLILSSKIFSFCSYANSPTAYSSTPSTANGWNLLQNPGFESGSFAPGWEYYGDPPGAHSSIDETVAHSGRFSAKVSFDGTEDVNYGHIVQKVKVVPGATYRLSGYIKTENLTTDSGALLEVQSSQSWTILSEGTEVITGTHNWTYVERLFTVPPSTSEIIVILRRIAWAGPINGTMWFDDIALTPIPSIKKLEPAVGHPGTVIVISGTNFGQDPGPGQRATAYNHISFGGNVLPEEYILDWSDTAITIVAPDSLTGGAISVTAHGENSNVVYFIEPVFDATFDMGLHFLMNDVGQWQIIDSLGEVSYYGGGRITWFNMNTGSLVGSVSVFAGDVITSNSVATITLQYPPCFTQTIVASNVNEGVQISYDTAVEPSCPKAKLISFNPYYGTPRGEVRIPGVLDAIPVGQNRTFTYSMDRVSIAPALMSTTPYNGVYILTGNHSIPQPILLEENSFSLPLVAHRPALMYQTEDPSRPDYSITGPYIPVDYLEGDYFFYASLKPLSFERYYRWFSHIENFPPRILKFNPSSAVLHYYYPEVQVLQDEFEAVGFVPDIARAPFAAKLGLGRQFTGPDVGPVSGWTPELLAEFDPGPTRTVTIKNGDGSEFLRSGWTLDFDVRFWVNPSHPGFLDFYWNRFMRDSHLRWFEFFWSDEGAFYPDYEPSLRDTPHASVFEGMLKFFALAHSNGYAQINNLVNFSIHGFKYLDLIDAELPSTWAVTNADHWTPYYRSHKYWDGGRKEESKYRQWQFQEAAFALKAMDNAPYRFITRDYLGYEKSDSTYALALALVKQTGQLASFSKSTENVCAPGYDEYEIARWMLNQQYAPRIESDDFLIYEAERTLPFGHSITIEVKGPVVISTDATHWQLDYGPEQIVVSNTISFTTTPGLHHLRVWRAHNGQVLHLERLDPEFHFVLGQPYVDKLGKLIGYRLEAIKGDWERDADPTFPQIRTRIAQPLLTGNTRAGARGVRLYEGRYADAKLLGETSADETGEWIFVPPEPLSPGEHFLTAVTLDQEGREPFIAEATSITLTVDLNAPAVSTIRFPIHRWRISDRTRLIYEWRDALETLTISTILGQDKITDTVEFYWDESLYGLPHTESPAALNFRFDPETNVGAYEVAAPFTTVRIEGDRPIYDVFLPCVRKRFPPPSILFDETHDEKNTISEERARQIDPEHPEWHYFGEFKDRVAAQYRLYRHSTGDLTAQHIRNFDIIMLAAPNKGLTGAEINDLIEFVREGGGLLVLLDEGINVDINHLLRHFGIEFDPAVLASPDHDWDAQSFAVSNFASHSVTKDLFKWHTNWGGSLRVQEPAMKLSWTDSDVWQDLDYDGIRDPDEKTGVFTLVAASTLGKGRIVVISDNAFHNGIFKDYNAPLILSALNWLASFELD